MKRILILRLAADPGSPGPGSPGPGPPGPGPIETALAGTENLVVRTLPAAGDSPQEWDALVAALLNADGVVTDRPTC